MSGEVIASIGATSWVLKAAMKSSHHDTTASYTIV
jgi:hypothetical protein